MKLATATRAADKLVELLAPACHRVQIAGSVRRGCAKCGDVEVLIIPKWGEVCADGDLFPSKHNLALLAIEAVGETLVPINPGVPIARRDPGWILKPEAEHWCLWMPNLQASADIFLCSPETWGLNLAIRTGSKDFSHALEIRWNDRGGTFADSRLVDRHGATLDTPEEADVFNELGIYWVVPAERTGFADIRPLGAALGATGGR